MLVPRLPERRRAASLLAVMFVPFVVASVLSGLAVCAGQNGVGLSWETNSDCPRGALGERPVQLQAPEAALSLSDCVVIEGADHAMAAVQAAPPQVMADAALVVRAAEAVPLSQPDLGEVQQRGPPAGSPHLVRSVVLRI